CLRAVIVDLPSDVHLPIGGFAVDATRRALLGATALGAGGLALMEVVAAAEAFTCFSIRECYASCIVTPLLPIGPSSSTGDTYDTQPKATAIRLKYRRSKPMQTNGITTCAQGTGGAVRIGAGAAKSSTSIRAMRSTSPRVSNTRSGIRKRVSRDR